MAQNDYDGLDNGGVLRNYVQAKDQFGVGCRHGIKSPSSKFPFQEQTRPSQRPQKTRNSSNWASNGDKMQAVFLGPKTKSLGTGVFIPRGQGTDPQFDTKPAFSPVLLPSRVVQALNLNVHELGQQIKPQPVQNKNTLKKIDEKSENNMADDASISPEILLPDEWTY